MAQLMLINPRKRTGGRKKPRTAAQKAATKRMLAANRAKHGGAPKRKAHKRRKNPIGLSRVVHHAKRAAHRVVHHKRRSARRRNPIGGSMRGAASGVMGMGMQALQGAGGALLVNTALNYIPMLPAALKSGNGKYIARVGVALAIGVFGKKVMPQKLATNMAVGAMTVALHDLLLGLAATAMPKLQLGDVGDYVYGAHGGAALAEYQPERIAYSTGMHGVDVYDTAGGIGEYVAH